MNFSKLIKIFSSLNDSFFFKKLKDRLIQFKFEDRHRPIKFTRKYYINKKYFINNFYYDIYDYSHVSQILYSSYEYDHFKFYLNSFKKNEIFIDIGSNIGIHSLFVLKYLRPKKVISIDPQQLCINLQKKTLKANNLNHENIEFINSGISKSATELKLFRNNTGSGTVVNDFGNDFVEIENISTHKITNTSMSEVFKKISKNLITIKIDTQGSENEILEEIHNSKYINLVKEIIFEVNKSDLNFIKKTLNKYTSEYKLIKLNGKEVSINDIDNHIKSCLVLSKK